jgi:nucleoside-diphosphate-sugar epimerase
MEVLVFGGSGFMGRATVRRFVEAGCDVTMANRGKCHWGESNPLRVNVMKCDRENPSDVVSVLKARQWKVLVDFTCFTPADIVPVLDFYASSSQRPFYVFVSTDNVYNLSEDRLLPEQKEEMTRFAADPQLRQVFRLLWFEYPRMF